MDIKPIARAVARDFGLPEELVLAVMDVESSGNTYAVRFEPGYRWLHEPSDHARRLRITLQTEITCQRMSWGPLQVMGATARELEMKDHLPMLSDPEVGLWYGCAYLRRQLDRYKGNMTDAIAAYNGGSAVVVKPIEGQGAYRNQAYVTKVLKAMRGLHAVS
jgi:soluble lytic murein transglycosylase-like protein